MGFICDCICKDCGAKCRITEEDSFFYHDLHCDKCGGYRSVLIEEVYAYFEKLDLDLLDKNRYNRLVEEFAGKCKCGGNYTFHFLLRCPKCRSTNLELST